jgi:hypothetical protein
MIRSASLNFLSIALLTIGTAISTVATTANPAAAQDTNHSDATCQNAYDDYLENTGGTSIQMRRANQALRIVTDCMLQYDELVRNNTSYCESAVAYANLVSDNVMAATANTIRSTCNSPTANAAAPSAPPQQTTPSNGNSGSSTRLPPHDVWLYQGGKQILTGQFYRNERIFGTCDVDCRDLDLKLYSTDGRLVAEDVLTDDFPVIVAPYDGIFTVEVVMHNCSHSAGCAAQIDSDYGF